MSLFWFCACAYLLFSAVGLLEADIRVKPGASPSTAQIVWTTLSFALAYPASAALRWMAARTRK
ncbi:hypothetical protein D3869_14730 (plasmid) [Azospirillum brasilense]|uniref:Uncharacterized protein n=1 Tax=Azospirillum brasilense TaxID=192 RepID=A0A4D8R4I9_AZOBR|nr:hypothetical protein D3869_14730 [Azospirillum brasilense]